MDRDTANEIARLDLEAGYAINLWDQAWNGGYQRTHDRAEEREFLQAAALALNALGNIRLAQAMYRRNTTR